MRIKKRISQHRRDFIAIFECEHCSHELETSGYDDSFFHQNVIPNMECKVCNKKSGSDYVAMKPKYDDNQTV